MRKQVKRFFCAFNGIWLALKEESHLRFHFIAAIYVIVFSFFFNLDAVKWAVVLLLIAAVISAELFNTALERLGDRITSEYDGNIKFAKDVSAAAVLILSISAVAVAFLFYFDIKKIAGIAFYILNNPWLLILFILSIIISIVFILVGPLGIKQFFRKG